MKIPATPINETERLEALRAANILDTGPEERFDRLTRLARRLFDVSIALVSLVDENRQWFKSKVGLEVCETDRDISFCGHAILGDDVFVIEDTLQDPRFQDNPLVSGPPYIRFYAGVPLRYRDGCKLGTLCIIDQQPRRLSADDLVVLRDLADMVENELAAIELAMVDDLTKVFNRRGFITLGQKNINLCARRISPVSVVILDLNQFKLINDRFGHAEGDRVLVNFAELMVKAFRDSDIVARLGGDEFAVLLVDASAADVSLVIARFRGLVDQYNRTTERGYQIGFDDGVVSLQPDSNSTVEDAMHAADVIMYENKLATRSDQAFVRRP